MDVFASRAAAAEILQRVGIATLPKDWNGCDAIWQALERMADEGATVVLKIDGKRGSAEDSGRYTIIVSGDPLGDNFFRVDTPILEVGLAQAVVHYARNCWGA